jgi:HPt (histidine-containing phosphotransfer) domain-containing protein
MDAIGQPNLSAALDRLWVQFLPQMEERVATLESSAVAFATGQLSPEQQKAANIAAHKLAGVLGTFGLTQGTILSRELEVLYSRESGLDSALAGRFAEIAAQLRALIQNRK